MPTEAPGGLFYSLGSVASLSLGGHCTDPSPGKTPGKERMHPGWRCARVLRPPEADPSAPGATAGRRRTAAAHAFPTDAAPGARGPELRGRCLLGWFQFHNTILNVWTAILKLPEVAHEQPWWKDEKERFIYSFISSFIIGEKPWFEVIDWRNEKGRHEGWENACLPHRHSFERINLREVSRLCLLFVWQPHTPIEWTLAILQSSMALFRPPPLPLKPFE